MGIRPTLMRALGAFVMTTVLFAAAMVIAHGLAIPDPARRILPTSEQDGPSALTSEGEGDDLTLGGNSLGTPQSLDEPPVAEVTAVPTPDTETGNSLRDDTEHRAAGTGDADDDPSVRDAVGDDTTERDHESGSAEGSSGPDAATNQGSPSTAPSSAASEPEPEPRSAPEPEPSDTSSEPSEAAEATQTSSLLLPSTDERDHDGADDDRYDDPWNSWWGGDHDHDHDHDRDRDGHRRGDDRDGWRY